MLDIKCIITIVERGKADKIVQHAKAGASGATICMVGNRNTK